MSGLKERAVPMLDVEGVEEGEATIVKKTSQIRFFKICESCSRDVVARLTPSLQVS
jgi:hypothetical protein